MQPAVDAGVFTRQAAEYHERERAQQGASQPVLPAWFTAGNYRYEENACCQVRRGHPEDGELQVPGPGDVEGQYRSQIDAEEIRDVRAVMLGGAAQQALQQK